MGTCTTRSVTLTLTRPRCRTGPPSWIVTTEEGSALAVHGAVPSVSSSTNTATFRSHTFAARATGTWTETSVRLTLTTFHPPEYRDEHAPGGGSATSGGPLLVPAVA